MISFFLGTCFVSFYLYLKKNYDEENIYYYYYYGTGIL